MLIGYARVSKADGSQSLGLQRDALPAEGVESDRTYEDRASGTRDDHPGLVACLRALREGDLLVVWKLDRLGRSLAHLVTTVEDLSERGIGLRVLTGQGARIDTSTVRRAAGVWDLRGAGRVRAGTDPRAHDRGAACDAGAGPQGRAAVRADEGPGAARTGRDGEPGHDRGEAVPGTGRRPGDPVPVGRSARRAAGAREARPRGVSVSGTLKRGAALSRSRMGTRLRARCGNVAPVPGKRSAPGASDRHPHGPRPLAGSVRRKENRARAEGGALHPSATKATGRGRCRS